MRTPSCDADPTPTPSSKFQEWAAPGAAFVEWHSPKKRVAWREALERLETPTFTYGAP